MVTVERLLQALQSEPATLVSVAQVQGSGPRMGGEHVEAERRRSEIHLGR